LIALTENHSNFVQEIRCQRCRKENLLIAELCHFVQKTQEWHQDQNAMQQVECLLNLEMVMIRLLQIVDKEILKLKKIKLQLNQNSQHAMVKMEQSELTA